MHTFIRATEIWVPTPDRTMLVCGGGLYGSATQFGAISRSMCFGRAEGLPGRAWDEGRPIVLRQLEGTYFMRAVAARAAGIACAVAMPVFVDEHLSAVIVFFCGGDGSDRGAIELWHNDPRVASDMTLVDGCYGTAAQALESLSRETYLPRGSGLPGLAWQQGAAVLIDDLGDSRRFLRGEDAAVAGIQRGLALPCSTPRRESYVMTFLSAAVSPIARRIESWALGADGAALVRNFGYCEALGGLSADDHIGLDDGGQGTVGRAFASGVPAISARAAAEPGAVGEAAAQAGLEALLAIPVISDDGVREVAVLYF